MAGVATPQCVQFTPGMLVTRRKSSPSSHKLKMPSAGLLLLVLKQSMHCTATTALDKLVSTSRSFLWLTQNFGKQWRGRTGGSQDEASPSRLHETTTHRVHTASIQLAQPMPRILRMTNHFSKAGSRKALIHVTSLDGSKARSNFSSAGIGMQFMHHMLIYYVGLGQAQQAIKKVNHFQKESR